MARPKIGDSESKRLQMVITEEELHAIETWQYANRVPSKSEAIRRLCQVGLLTVHVIDLLVYHGTEIADGTFDDLQIAEASLQRFRSGEKRDVTPEAFEKLLVAKHYRAERVYNAVSLLHEEIEGLFEAATPLLAPGNVQKAAEEAAKVITRSMDQVQERATSWQSRSRDEERRRMVEAMEPEQRRTFETKPAAAQDKEFHKYMSRVIDEWEAQRKTIQQSRKARREQPE